MSALQELSSQYQAQYGDKLQVLPEFRGETTWFISKDSLIELMTALKADGFDFLIDLSTVDNMGDEPRFEGVYELFSFAKQKHLRIKTSTTEEEASLPTVSHLWATANWHEREAWDMMGIKFEGHPDLRRILMWDGYPYFPLRKEFPLEGKTVEMPDIPFTKPAPLEGGPFVTSPTTCDSRKREPRAHPGEANG